MGAEAGWWLCAAELHLQSFDLVLWFRFLIFDSRVCFLAWLFVNSSTRDSSSHGRNSPRPNAASPVVLSLPWSYPFTSHATQSMLLELAFQNLNWFNVIYTIICKMGKICKHGELSLEDFHREIFLLKIQALLQPGEVLGVLTSNFFILLTLLHTGPLSFCKTLDKAAIGERKREGLRLLAWILCQRPLQEWPFAIPFYCVCLQPNLDHHRYSLDTNKRVQLWNPPRH